MHKSRLKRFGNRGIIFMPLCWSSFLTAGETEADEVIHRIRAELGLNPHVEGPSVLITRQYFPKTQSDGTERGKTFANADKVWDKRV